MNASFIIGTVLVAALPFAALSAPVTVFEDNFDTENGGASSLNYVSFANFAVSDGTVDLISSGGYGITCVGGSGSCVDMDGSTGNAGIMTSSSMMLNAGQGYTLTFDISGNQRNSGTDVLDFGIGGHAWQISRAGGAPWETLSYDFTVGSTGNYSAFFSNQGGDNFGMILDNVMVTTAPVPVPAGLPLLAGAFGALAILRRRRG